MVSNPLKGEVAARARRMSPGLPGLGAGGSTPGPLAAGVGVAGAAGVGVTGAGDKGLGGAGVGSVEDGTAGAGTPVAAGAAVAVLTSMRATASRMRSGSSCSSAYCRIICWISGLSCSCKSWPSPYRAWGSGGCNSDGGVSWKPEEPPCRCTATGSAPASITAWRCRYIGTPAAAPFAAGPASRAMPPRPVFIFPAGRAMCCAKFMPISPNPSLRRCPCRPSARYPLRSHRSAPAGCARAAAPGIRWPR